ncbi:collagen alpha-1(III) chain-like [Panthera uncia]|uniref:collagen alpha-1(III) chain-like n=1 Tax=Panthera uncia TaxID=29064 RepID=UPI0020FFA35E|nr:collagen alpha-1(III) chain-like [Panthera uncia]
MAGSLLRRRRSEVRGGPRERGRRTLDATSPSPGPAGAAPASARLGAPGWGREGEARREVGRRGSSGSRQARRERGRPELRAQPAGSGSAPAAPPPPRWLQPPGRPGVGSFGESLPGYGRRRRRAGARSRRPRAGRGLQRLGGVPEAVGALAPDAEAMELSCSDVPLYVSL